MNSGDVIEVLWVDANSPRESRWELVDDYVSDTPVMEIFSCGYFVEKKDGYLRMVGDRSGQDIFEEVVNRVFNIPLGCVRKVNLMAKKKKGGKKKGY
jgi:hypothetical protein